MPHSLYKATFRTSLAICLAAAVASTDLWAEDIGMGRPAVKKIQILGNMSFDDGVIKKRMRTKEIRFYHLLRKPKFRMDFLRRDLEAIRSFYNKKGFLDAKVTIDSIDRDDKSNSVKIRIMVNEGPQTVIRRLEFTGQDLITEDNLRKGLELVEGEPYNPNLLEADRYQLFRKLFERGYLGAEVAYDADVDSLEVDVTWRLVPGEPIDVEGISVTGNSKVEGRLIRRELIFESGERFDMKKVLESKQNLYDTGYFTSVEIEPDALDMQRRQVDLVLQVRERKMGYLETGLGVGNVHGNRLFAEWGQRNLLGRGYALNLKTSHAFRLFPENEYAVGKIDFRSKFMRHEGELRFPHILSTWNTFALGAYYERDATVDPVIVKARSFSATVSRRFTRHTSLLLSYALENIKRQEIEEERAQSRRRSLNFTFVRDSRDFYFNPRRGMYITIEGGYTGGLLGGEDNFYSTVVSFQRYQNLNERTIFAYRIRTGYAQTFGDSREAVLPIESRFFAGGGNSVRGYRENSLGPRRDSAEPRGGRVLLLTNVELRFPLPYFSRYNFGAAVFLDGGNVWNSVEEIQMKHFRLFSDRDDTTFRDYMYGAGFGLRYYTPVGPVRIDAGLPLKKTETIDYDFWIHISLGQIF